MAERILFAWVGHADLRGPLEEKEKGAGPIAQALAARAFDETHLLHDMPAAEARGYVAWLRKRTTSKIVLHHETLTSPVHFGEIYEAAVRVVNGVLEGEPAVGRKVAAAGRAIPDITFHLSPGTPAMAAVWIILGKTRFPATLIESSRDHGVKTASVPFDLSAEFLPDLLRKPDEELERLSAGLPPDAPEFDAIIHRSAVMKRIILRARQVAPRSIPVLIEGESGTGKELLARAIHNASPRRERRFVPVNCGAIPGGLVEAELFGHEKGAFTGAERRRIGYFETAHGGTLFLDEVGELPSPAQVKLLRVLQEKKITRVGSTEEIAVDVRVVSATNRSLLAQVAEGAFRPDLFYRLAVAVLQLPPIRERPGDLGLLIDRLLDRVNEESATDPGYQKKHLSSGARNLLLEHKWPGNVRELLNTLRRASIWTSGGAVTAEDIRDALLPPVPGSEGDALHRPLGQGFSLHDLLAEVARHYLVRALDEARGNKTKAAELVGLPSYQTLTNWLQKYGVESGT